jgi:hypothetical protein
MNSNNINWNRFKYSADNDFFRKWNPKMAYILGFTCADGGIHRKTLTWELSKKHESDKELLQRINGALESTYPIECRAKSIRLRISNPLILQSLLELGIMPNKSKILRMPVVPSEYLRDFARGFLDGDGWITTRIKSDCREISIGFCSGSKEFLKEFANELQQAVKIDHINFRHRTKYTKKQVLSNWYQIECYAESAYKIIKFIYDDLKNDDIYLERKFRIQMKAREFFIEMQARKKITKRWHGIEKEQNCKIEKLLQKFLFEDRMKPVEIARELNISLATVYRWLEKTKVRLPSNRGSEEWKQRILSWNH